MERESGLSENFFRGTLFPGLSWRAAGLLFLRNPSEIKRGWSGFSAYFFPNLLCFFVGQIESGSNSLLFLVKKKNNDNSGLGKDFFNLLFPLHSCHSSCASNWRGKSFLGTLCVRLPLLLLSKREKQVASFWRGETCTSAKTVTQRKCRACKRLYGAITSP